MNGVTFINHYGPNNLFAGVVSRANDTGTDLGSIFNVEYNIEKGDKTEKGYATFFVTPGSGKYIQFNDGSGNVQLARVLSSSTEEVEVHDVVDTTVSAGTPPNTLNVKKSVLRLRVAPIVSGGNANVDLPIEVIYNAEAVSNIERILSAGSLMQLQNESKQITQANLPKLAVYEPTATAQKILSEKNSAVSYSRIKRGDPRVNRFSLTRYPDRDNVEELGIEYYLTFKHTKVTKPNKKPREVEDRIAITMDYHNQPMVTMKDPFGIEETYTLQGFGTAKPPVKEGETSYTEDEVVYLDVINQTSQKQRIYLPAEKKKNPEFIKNLKSLIELKTELHNLNEVSAPPAVKELSDTLMNETFDADRIPDGNLLYKKDDVTYLYLQNDAKNDHLRLMQKDGVSGLFINLDGVNDNSTTPPTTFPEGTTFEIKRFQFGNNSAGENVLQALVSDGNKLHTVSLPIKSTEANFLLDGSGNLLQPDQVASTLAFLTVDENTYPNCKNKKITDTTLGDNLTGYFHYTKRDGSGNVLQTYQYLSYKDGATEKHLQLIEKDGKIYGNFHTDSSDPNQFETCLIEKITRGATASDPCSVTFVAGDPGQRYAGTIDIKNTTENAGVLDILEKINDTTNPTRFPLTTPASREIESAQLPPIFHEPTGKTPIDDLEIDGELKTNSNKAKGKVSLIEQTNDFLGLGARAFSQPIKLPNDKEQKLSTFHSDETLLTVSLSSATTPLAEFKIDGTNTILNLSESEAVALGIEGLATSVSGGICKFDVTAVQLSQKAGQDVVIKSGSNDLRLSFSSQGIVATTVDRTSGAVLNTVRRRTSDILDIGVSDKFYESAVKSPTEFGCTIERDGSGKIANQDLKDALLESFTREQRARVIDGANPSVPLTFPDGTQLFSIPYNTGNPPVINENTDFLDFMISPDNKLYQYQHRRNESSKGGAGSPTKPGYKEVRQLVFRENPDNGKTYFVSTLAGKPAVSTLGIDLTFEQSSQLMNFVDSCNAGLSLTTPLTAKNRTINCVDGSSHNILVDIDNSDYGSTLIGDDGVAQLQRAAGTSATYPAVAGIEDATPAPLNHFEQIKDPDARKIGPTRDEIVADTASEKPKKPLWKGISDSNRPLWIGVFTLVTLFSVLLPILGIVSGAMLGIIVASDSKVFSEIMIGPRKYRQPTSTLQGRLIERSMNKNKSRIKTYNSAIKSVQAQIEKVTNDTSLSPAEKSAELAKLNAQRASYEAERNRLARENERLSVDLAKNSDKELLALKKEKAELQPKMDRINSLIASGDLNPNPTAANRMVQITHIDQLTKDRANASVKNVLEQQKLYLLYQEKNSGGRVFDSEEQKEFNKLSKKYDFNEKEVDELRTLQQKKEAGSLSKEELERLKRLMEMYGKSPLAALRDYFFGVSERADRREEEVSAMATRYAEEHPENGFRDFKFEEEQNSQISDANSAYAAENERRKLNVNKRLFSEKSSEGRGGR